jgi:hypothetical protein
MRNLILAASLSLLAVPAFAADTTASQQTAMATSAQQKHTYNYSNYEGTSSAIAIRNERLRRAEDERSANAKFAWSNSVHYY